MKNIFDSVISDDRILVYLEDAMSGTERRHFEREALLTGELRQLQHMRRSIYMAHMEYADELVGEDEFNLDNIFNANDAIINTGISNITHNQYTKFAERIKELIASKSNAMSCNTHLVSELMKSHPNISKVEAERIIEQIQDGVDKYYDDFNSAIGKESEYDFSIFERQMEDMSIEDRCLFLANAIILFRACNNKLGNECKERSFEVYHKELYDGMIPSEELVIKLTQICKEEMENTNIPDSLIDETMLSRMTDNQQIDSSIRELLGKRETAYYLGYILYEEKGNVNNSKDIDPFIIGLGAGAAVTQAEIMAGSSGGDSPSAGSKFKNFLKIAIAVAAFALVAYLISSLWIPLVGIAAPMLVSAGAGFFLNLFMGLAGIMVLGSAILCTLLWSFAAGALAYYLMEALIEWIESRRSEGGTGSGSATTIVSPVKPSVNPTGKDAEGDEEDDEEFNSQNQ